jgi:uncharacterized protein (UPF0261 family)
MYGYGEAHVMTKTVVLVGALDTKGADFPFVKGLVEQQGLRILLVDFGVLGEPALVPDIGRDVVATAGGSPLQELRTGDRKDHAMQTMARGLAHVCRQLYDDGRLDGILGMGGTGGTSIATAAMRALPVGVPKVMVSTVGGGDVSAYTEAKDITFIPSIVDVAGINRISRRIYANAAAAISGMVGASLPASDGEKPLVTASMFGNTTAAVERARLSLEDRGYEVLIFHATGMGGKTMESLIADGYISASLDMTTTELADYVCGGVFSAGPDRCMAASRAGIPTVLVPGCVDMANFGAIETLPEAYRGRLLYQWNPNVTLLRTNVAENRRIGEMLATAANAASGPVALFLPLRGVSMLDSEAGSFWDPEADQACYAAIRHNLKRNIPVVEMDRNINDPEFADRAAALLLDLMEQKGTT